jgi:predicted aminopeptidase
MMMLFGLTTGCSSLSFVFQAAQGQLKILNRGRPLVEVLQDPTADPKLVELLRQVPDFKRFGESYGLKSTQNYEEYVKLDHPAASYVVTIAHKLKMEPMVFSFPIVGSFNYLGWFHPEDAKSFAKKYSEQGYDVDIRGASAFSTLGWFKDPILSSMVVDENQRVDETALPDLLNVILHESVHATVYIEHQSNFNEQLASFVADVLTDEYFKGRESAAFKKYIEQKSRGVQIRQRMKEVFEELNRLYASSMSDQEKLSQKMRMTSALQSELQFRRPINNATLIQFKTYDPTDQGFESLYERSGRNMLEFMARIKKIQPSDFERLGCKRQCDRFTGLLERL